MLVQDAQDVAREWKAAQKDTKYSDQELRRLICIENLDDKYWQWPFLGAQRSTVLRK